MSRNHRFALVAVAAASVLLATPVASERPSDEEEEASASQAASAADEHGRMAAGVEAQLVGRLHELRRHDESVLKEAIARASALEKTEEQGQKRAAQFMTARARVLEDVLHALGGCSMEHEIIAVSLSKLAANIQEIQAPPLAKKVLVQDDLKDVWKHISTSASQIETLRSRLASLDSSPKTAPPASLLEEGRAVEVADVAELGQLTKTADSAVQRHQAYNDAMAKIDSYARKERALEAGFSDIAKTRARLLDRGLAALEEQSLVYKEYLAAVVDMNSTMSDQERSQEEMEEELLHSLAGLKLKTQTQAQRVQEVKTSIEDAFHMTEIHAQSMLEDSAMGTSSHARARPHGKEIH